MTQHCIPKGSRVQGLHWFTFALENQGHPWQAPFPFDLVRKQVPQQVKLILAIQRVCMCVVPGW